MTLSEVVSVAGKPGSFSVKVKCLPRFIDEKLCTGCGTCGEKCPVKVPAEFDMGIGVRKAAFVPFPQAVPFKYLIDSKNCTFFLKGRCRLCEKFCPTKAVRFEQQPVETTIDAASIVVATGFSPYMLAAKGPYGIGVHKNVVTALEFERMLSASGPTKGHVLRPSDSKPPKRLVFIQCAGSRETGKGGKPYCSGFCCTYAIKDSILAREHEPSIESVSVLHMDLRTYGKGFEDFYRRARDKSGIEFLRGRAAKIETADTGVRKTDDSLSDSLIVHVEDTRECRSKPVPADMVVLANAMRSQPGIETLAQKLSVSYDRHGFINEAHPKLRPVETNTAGIFV
ncbi:MAG: FAD-dependent oxidoreductase, partial [Planctomycetota bacterium]|nr:FAD-dependent oxidoreductase [Planctomycetota bacterium]